MKTIFLIGVLLLTGCVGVPVDRNFPAVPESFKQACPDLELVESDNTRLSRLLSVTASNYKTYYECQIKVEAWQEWYNTQQQIFESTN
jgi:hypothetical protein